MPLHRPFPQSHEFQASLLSPVRHNEYDFPDNFHIIHESREYDILPEAVPSL